MILSEQENHKSEMDLNLSTRIYESLKKSIVELKYAPGSLLQERQLAEALGASRTPVREAIKRLVQEGWLVGEDRRRVVVKALSLKSAKDVFEFRSMVEPFALTIAFEKGEARSLAGKLDFQIQKMASLRGDRISFIKADMVFHTLIVENTGNDLLTRIWKNISEEIIRIAIFSMDEARRTEIILSEHTEIVQALWEGRKDSVLEMLALHHRNILEGLERGLSQKLNP
jgi:DNA-binding GntR family transcriptional regulator